MSENNLPIKLVLPKAGDISPNIGGGKLKFFGEVTPELKKELSDKFATLSSFYSELFNENEEIPAVGKITNGLRKRGYITNNLEVKHQVRQRQ